MPATREHQSSVRVINECMSGSRAADGDSGSDTVGVSLLLVVLSVISSVRMRMCSCDGVECM